MPQCPHLPDENSHAYLKGLLEEFNGQNHVQLGFSTGGWGILPPQGTLVMSGQIWEFS